MKKNVVDYKVMLRGHMYICCPKCGRKNTRSALACNICKCEQCGTDFKAYVNKRTVVIIPYEKNETEIESYIRIKHCLEEIVQLTDEEVSDEQ